MSDLKLQGGVTKKQRTTLSGGTDRVSARKLAALWLHVQRSVLSRLTFERNGDSLPYGFYAASFKKYLDETDAKLRFSDITCDDFRYRVGVQSRAGALLASGDEETQHMMQGVEEGNNDQEEEEEEEDSMIMEEALRQSCMTKDQHDAEVLVRKGGRPKTVIAAEGEEEAIVIRSEEDIRRLKALCANWICEEIERLEAPTAAGSSKVKCNHADVVRRGETQFLLPPGSILPSTISHRLKSGNTFATKPGPPALLEKAGIESLLCEICLEYASHGFPLSQIAIIALANDLLCGTPVEEEIERRKIRDKFTSRNADGTVVGDTWLKGFKQRFKHSLEFQYPELFDINRAVWTQYGNYERFYDSLDAMILRCGLGREVSGDGDVKVVIDDRSLRYILFADECGANTNMEEDNARAGGKVAVALGAKATQVISKKDQRWTLIPIINAAGECVMAVVIFKMSGKVLKDDWATGIDFANILGAGVGSKPGGPICTVGKFKIPTFVTFSESGGVTSEIFTEVWARIDASGLFGMERAAAACLKYGWTLADMLCADVEDIDLTSDGRTPASVLDGHFTRLSLIFLLYIDFMKSTTPWGSALGVPYNTHIWQIGDSEAANGAYKDHLSRSKRTILLARTARGTHLGSSQAALQPTDVIPLVCKAWSESFEKVSKLQRALERRGLNPLNRKLLSDPDVLKTKKMTSASSSATSSTSTSTNNSSSASSAGAIPQPAPLLLAVPPVVNLQKTTTTFTNLSALAALKLKAAEVASQENKRAAASPDAEGDEGEEGDEERVRPFAGSRVSAGNFYKNSATGMLSDGEMLQELVVRDLAKESHKQAKEENAKARESKRKNAFKELLEKTEKKKKTPKEWNKGELVIACTYKQLGVESYLKKQTIEELKALWKSSKAQSTVSDSEAEEDEEEVMQEEEEGEEGEDDDQELDDDDEQEEEEEDEATTKFLSLSKEQRARLMTGFK